MPNFLKATLRRFAFLPKLVSVYWDQPEQAQALSAGTALNYHHHSPGVSSKPPSLLCLGSSTIMKLADLFAEIVISKEALEEYKYEGRRADHCVQYAAFL